jgi:hypothetical protein
MVERIVRADAPGVNIARTPISLRCGMSSSGIVAPPNTRMFAAPRCASRSITRWKRNRWAPLSTLSPIPSTPSRIAASTISSGRRRMPA